LDGLVARLDASDAPGEAADASSIRQQGSQEAPTAEALKLEATPSRRRQLEGGGGGGGDDSCSSRTVVTQCRVKSSAVAAGSLNVTGDVHFTGTVFWHGREWGPNDPTPVPTPSPSSAPAPAPTGVPFPAPTPPPTALPLIANAVTAAMAVSSYDPTPGASVCNKGCVCGYWKSES
jgi:hypothetical protein